MRSPWTLLLAGSMRTRFARRVSCCGGYWWQVERDVVGDPAVVWEATRARIGREGFCARLLALQHPIGRVISFQIAVADCTRIAASLDAAGVSLFMSPKSKWYRVAGDEEVGVKQFVADSDGYLLRFQSSLGYRPVDSLRTW
ncbi:MAG: hypothetical protein WBD41_28040 [Rhodococcus sp. (in: high G+C Gram-positive bacteria)]